MEDEVIFEGSPLQSYLGNIGIEHFEVAEFHSNQDNINRHEKNVCIENYGILEAIFQCLKSYIQFELFNFDWILCDLRSIMNHLINSDLIIFEDLQFLETFSLSCRNLNLERDNESLDSFKKLSASFENTFNYFKKTFGIVNIFLVKLVFGISMVLSIISWNLVYFCNLIFFFILAYRMLLVQSYRKKAAKELSSIAECIMKSKNTLSNSIRILNEITILKNLYKEKNSDILDEYHEYFRKIISNLTYHFLSFLNDQKQIFKSDGNELSPRYDFLSCNRFVLVLKDQVYSLKDLKKYKDKTVAAISALLTQFFIHLESSSDPYFIFSAIFELNCKILENKALLCSVENVNKSLELYKKIYLLQDKIGGTKDDKETDRKVKLPYSSISGDFHNKLNATESSFSDFSRNFTQSKKILQGFSCNLVLKCKILTLNFIRLNELMEHSQDNLEIKNIFELLSEKFDTLKCEIGSIEACLEHLVEQSDAIFNPVVKPSTITDNCAVGFEDELEKEDNNKDREKIIEVRELNEPVIEDEAFYFTVDDVDSFKTDLYSNNESKNESENSRKERKRQRNRCKRVLSEMQPILKERKELWRQREKAALEKKGAVVVEKDMVEDIENKLKFRFDMERQESESCHLELENKSQDLNEILETNFSCNFPSNVTSDILKITLPNKGNQTFGESTLIDNVINSAIEKSTLNFNSKNWEMGESTLNQNLENREKGDNASNDNLIKCEMEESINCNLGDCVTKGSLNDSESGNLREITTIDDVRNNEIVESAKNGNAKDRKKMLNVRLEYKSEVEATISNVESIYKVEEAIIDDHLVSGDKNCEKEHNDLNVENFEFFGAEIGEKNPSNDQFKQSSVAFCSSNGIFPRSFKFPVGVSFLGKEEEFGGLGEGKNCESSEDEDTE